jgi:very-short-patch-repair endonuclease
VITQAKFDWCRNDESRRCLPFDFLIEEYKIFIELDGPQHFTQVSNWRSPEEQQRIDKYKMECANHHGYSIIRVLQEDVLNNKIVMDDIEKGIYYHETPQKIYIATTDAYRVY